MSAEEGLKEAKAENIRLLKEIANLESQLEEADKEVGRLERRLANYSK